MTHPLVAKIHQDYLTEDDAALALGVARGTLRNWRSRGRGPDYAKLGRRVLYPATSIQKHISQSARPAGGLRRDLHRTK